MCTTITGPIKVHPLSSPRAPSKNPYIIFPQVTGSFARNRPWGETFREETLPYPAVGLEFNNIVAPNCILPCGMERRLKACLRFLGEADSHIARWSSFYTSSPTSKNTLASGHAVHTHTCQEDRHSLPRVASYPRNHQPANINSRLL